jgi:hypothetical protein
VANLHNYAVGHSGVQVHNSSGPSQQPPLQRIHSDQTLLSGSSRYSLDYWRKQSTDDIVRSLRPGNIESLRVKPDGRIMNGNTRIKVLEERGFDINSLPREIVP